MEVTTAAPSYNGSAMPVAFPVLMLMMPFMKTDNSSGNFSRRTGETLPIIPSGRALDKTEVGNLRAMNFLPPGSFIGGRQPMRANVPWGMWFWAFQVGRHRPNGGGDGSQGGQPQQHPQMPPLLPPPGAMPPMPLPGPFPPQMPPFMPPPHPQPQPHPQPPQSQINPIFPFAPFFPPMIPPMPLPPQPQPPVTEYPPSTPSEETEPPPTQTPEAPSTSSATTEPTRFLFPNCGLSIPELMAKNAASSSSASGSGMNPVARQRNQLRIVGGRDTPIDAIPWQVSLQRPRNYEMRHYCGGSVIHPQFILTAAHCLDW